MAVEKKTVVKRFRALFPKVNLSQARIDTFVAKLIKKLDDDADEAAIDLAINDLNDNSVLSFEELAKEDDKTRKLEADAKKKADKKGKTETDDDDTDDLEDEDPNDSPTDKLLKQMAKTLSTVKTDLDNLKSGKLNDEKKTTAAKAFEDSEVFKKAPQKVKDFMLKNIDVNSEVLIEDQVAELETTYTDLFQGKVDENEYPGAAGGGGKDVAVDAKKVDEVLDNMGV